MITDNWNMKKLIYLFIVLVFSLACSDTLEEEIVSKYPNGTPMKINYFKWEGDNKTVLKEVRFYPNGEKELQGEYNSEGKREGEWIYWYSNGNKWSEGTFKNDMSDGNFTIWFESGRKNYEAGYKEGKPHGKWTFYDDDGKKYKEVIFEMGQKTGEKDFD